MAHRPLTEDSLKIRQLEARQRLSYLSIRRLTGAGSRFDFRVLRVVEEAGQHFVISRLAPAYGFGRIWVEFVLRRIIEPGGYQEPCAFRGSHRLFERIVGLPGEVVAWHVEHRLGAPVGIEGLDLHRRSANV